MYTDICRVSFNISSSGNYKNYKKFTLKLNKKIYCNTFSTEVEPVLDENNILKHLKNHRGFFKIRDKYYTISSNRDNIGENQVSYHENELYVLDNNNEKDIIYIFNDFNSETNIKDGYFSFGENWKDFSTKTLNEKIININNEYINKLLTTNKINIKNMTILDLGCGSGINTISLSFHNPMVIYAIDYDQHSVECTKNVVNLHGNKSVKYEILQGSILDDNFIKNFIGKFDFIYCYGVLHHTGDMYKALDNTFKLMRTGSNIYLGLYSHFKTFELDLKNKVTYFSGDTFEKNELIADYATVFKNWHVKSVDDLKNQKWNIVDYRGMNRYHDMVDWLGGFPYEVISCDILKLYVRNKGLEIKNHIDKINSVNTYIMLKK